MNRAFSVVFLGLAAGIISHQAWLNWRGPCTSDDLSCQLAWIRDDLRLTNEQFSRVVDLHVESSSRLRELALDVSRMQDEFDEFEHARVSEGRVDFLEFARFVDERRQLEAAVGTSARSLIAATADVMSPQQRLRYLALVAPAASSPAESPVPR